MSIPHLISVNHQLNTVNVNCIVSGLREHEMQKYKIYSFIKIYSLVVGVLNT